jgi:hypothetical protein
MAKNRKPYLNVADTLHFANLGSNVWDLNGFGPIAAVNTNWHDVDERYSRLGMRLSF